MNRRALRSVTATLRLGGTVIPNTRTGRPGYVLIDTTSGVTTAVPYAAVMDCSRLERAPRPTVNRITAHNSVRRLTNRTNT